MLSTEIQRIVLLVLLAVVGYLLVYTWDQDYGRKAAESPPRAAPVVGGDAGVPTVPPVREDDVPSVPPSVDVPSEELAGTATPTLQSLEVGAGQLVHVRTPVLGVWIDLLGGDVVGLQLPAYPEEIGSDVPVRLLDRNRQHVYVAQSGWTGRDGLDKAGVRPLYTATAFVGGRPYMGAETSEYAIDEGTLTVTLEHRAGELLLRKRFVFEAEDYLITVEHEIDNRTSREFSGRLFAQLKRDSSRPEATGFIGVRPYVGAAFTTPETRYEKIDFDDLDEEQFRTELTGGWAAVLQHYFIAAWIGDPEEVNAYNGRKLSDGNYAVGFVGPELVVPPGRNGVATAMLYAGPKVQRNLEAAAPNLYLTVDYGLFWWLSVPLFQVLDAIHSVVGNWGVAIMLVTLAVKLLLYPLASAGFRSMAKLKRLAPQVKRLQERYAGDRQKLTQETMALYKKEGANPLGGCLPLVLQMPVFFALYWVLFESVELRHAPFMLWINDLSAPDPWYVLPILYGASFFLMQMLQPPMSVDPMQAKVMKMMPILFTVLFVFFPAGLVLYWLVNNILSLAQQWYITRSVEKRAASKPAV